MEQKKRFIMNVIYYALVAAIVLLFAQYILPILTPFLLAFAVAFVLRIPAKRISGSSEKRQKRISILLAALFYILLFMLVVMVGLKAIGGVEHLIEAAPKVYSDTLVPFMSEVSDRLENAVSSFDANIAEKIEAMSQELIQKLGNLISEYSVKIVKAISEGIVGIPGVFVKLILMVVSTFFIASDYDKIKSFLQKYIPGEKKYVMESILYHGKTTLFSYVKSYTILFLMTFVELTVGFAILGLPYPVLLGFAIAVFDILPVLGTGGILLPWAAFLFFMSNTPLAMGLVILYIVITIIRNALEPKIVGKQIGLHPLATLIAMFVGLKLLGILGMIGFPMGLTILVNYQKDKTGQN